MKTYFTILLLMFTTALIAQATSVWNPAANPGSDGLWSNAANWTSAEAPNGNAKVVFNVQDAQDCLLNDVRTIFQFVLGDNGPGGTLIVGDGGDLTTSTDIWSAVGYNDTSRLVVETGGVVTFGQHMWIGLTPDGYGTVELNGGTINVGAQTGLGWDGGTGFVYVNDGVLNMAGFDPNMSIGEGSLLQVGDGTVTINGNQVGGVEAYVTAGKITGQGGSTLDIVYNEMTDKTVITAAATPQATTVWNPVGNPGSMNRWNEAANWSDGFVPNGNKVVFNVMDAPNALLNTDAADIFQFVLGDNGPGGTLVVGNGGDLTTSADIWSAVGYNDTARLVVETGGVVTFGQHMWIGLTPDGYGTVELNGGTINVSAQTGLGWDGGTGFVYVNDGVLNMTGFDPNMSIGDGSLLEVGDGTININGNQVSGIEAYVTAGKVTGRGGSTLEIVYDEMTDKTVITAGATPQATTVWNPAGNTGSMNRWNEAANWSDGFVPNGNKVVFNVMEAPNALLNTDAADIFQFVLGDNGPGGTLVVGEGGNLSTSADIWSSVGYNDTARLVVETGGVVNFGQHMWIGLTPDGYGTVDLNGGTINVGAQTGLGWDGGTGFVNLNDGILNMTGFDPNMSIGDGSVLDITEGTAFINGDQVASVEAYVTSGKITAYGGAGNVMAIFNSGTGKTMVTAEETSAVGDQEIDGKIELRQNYPNPFNQATTISFTLKERADVQLEIFDVAGRRVAELINRKMAVGDHQVVWEAVSFPPGVYIVKLKSGSGILARQINLSR